MNAKYKKLDNATKLGIRRHCIKMIKISIGNYIDGKSLASHKNEVLFSKYEEIYKQNPVNEYLKYLIIRTAPKEKIGFVYFAINDKQKLCKIGFSMNPYSRLKSLQTGCPFPIRLYRTIEGSTEKEKELHRRFQQYKSNGEWFFIKDRLLDYLKELA